MPGVGMDKRKFIETMEGWPGWAQDQSEDGKALRAAVTEVWKLKRDQIRSSGYVLHTIQAAVWAFLVTDNFKSGALLCANLGDDADTVAAVYGGIAGAWYGAKDDPEKRFWGDEKVEGWIKGLNMRGSIEKCAEGLAVLEGGCVREIK